MRVSDLSTSWNSRPPHDHSRQIQPSICSSKHVVDALNTLLAYKSWMSEKLSQLKECEVLRLAPELQGLRNNLAKQMTLSS